MISFHVTFSTFSHFFFRHSLHFLIFISLQCECICVSLYVCSLQPSFCRLFSEYHFFVGCFLFLCFRYFLLVFYVAETYKSFAERFPSLSRSGNKVSRTTHRPIMMLGFYDAKASTKMDVMDSLFAFQNGFCAFSPVRTIIIVRSS